MSFSYTPRLHGSGKYGTCVYQQDSSYLLIPRVWRSNIHRTLLEDMVPARGIRGIFTSRIDYHTKRKVGSQPDHDR